MEGLNLYEIVLPFAVKVQGKADALPFTKQRQAFYGSKTEAMEYVLAALNRDLEHGRLIRVDLTKDSTDEKHIFKEIIYSCFAIIVCIKCRL